MTEPAPDVNTPAALVLDVDGTLLDTVHLPVVAWWEAFVDGGSIRGDLAGVAPAL